MAVVTVTYNVTLPPHNPSSYRANAMDGFENAMAAIKRNRISFWIWQAHCLVTLMLGLWLLYTDAWPIAVATIATSFFGAAQVFVSLNRWGYWQAKADGWLSKLEQT